MDVNVRDIDVFKLESYVNKCVKIKLKRKDVVLEGIVYTVDPVSQNFLLAKKDKNEMELIVVLNDAIKEIIVEDEVPEYLTNVDINSLFSSSPVTANVLQKTNVIKWLKLSKIPFTEKNNILEVEGVKIHPPYNERSCISDNPIRLQAILNMLKTVQQLIEKKDPRLIEN